jgi:hypothetical protein
MRFSMKEANAVLIAMKKVVKSFKAGEIVELTGLDKKIVDKKALKTEGNIVSLKVCCWEPKK